MELLMVGPRIDLHAQCCVKKLRRPTQLPPRIDEEWHPETPLGGVGSDLVSVNGGEWYYDNYPEQFGERLELLKQLATIVLIDLSPITRSRVPSRYILSS